MELDYDTYLFLPDETDVVGREKRMEYLGELKRRLIPVLKDSPSDQRKFLRWKLSENHWSLPFGNLLENGVLEVLPETTPAT